MSRAYLSFLSAAAAGSAFVLAPISANAGCGCGHAATYVAPPVYYVQPAPTVVQVQPAPVVVKVAPPQVIVEQAAYPAVVPTYTVNQGPVYSGPGADYSVPVYEPARPLPPYPYVRGWRWRSQYFHHRHPRVYGNWKYQHRVAMVRGPHPVATKKHHP